jgi:hypothetical protein
VWITTRELVDLAVLSSHLVVDFSSFLVVLEGVLQGSSHSHSVEDFTHGFVHTL